MTEAKRLRTLEDKNAKLKRLLAEAMLDNAELRVKLHDLAQQCRRFGWLPVGIVRR